MDGNWLSYCFIYIDYKIFVFTGYRIGHFICAIDLVCLSKDQILGPGEKVYVQQKEKMIQGGLQTMPIDISKAIY